jgi:hypothetical protein
MAFSRHTVGDQSPSERLCLYPDSGSLTRARNLVRGSHLDVLSASRRCAPSGLILDDGQLESDHRTAVFPVWRKANPWGGATAGHTQIGLLAHITSGD